MHVAVAEFLDSIINLSCLSDSLDFPTLDQIYLRNVAMRCVSQMFLLILCLLWFIIMGYRDKVIQHHIALKS